MHTIISILSPINLYFTMYLPVCQAIRETVLDSFGEEVASSIRIQYGGSVKPENIEELLSKEHIDGALVGGASLQVDSFVKLLEAGENV